MEEIGS